MAKRRMYYEVVASLELLCCVLYLNGFIVRGLEGVLLLTLVFYVLDQILKVTCAVWYHYLVKNPECCT